MNFGEFLENHYGVKPKLSDRYGDWLGYEIDVFDKDKGTTTTRLKVREDHLSPSGAVHGGVISGFLDFSCGCAVITSLQRNELCSTVELNVKYFKPLREGDEIIAEARLVNRGKTLCSVVAEVYKADQKEKAVALATGTFNIYDVKKITKKN